MYEVACLIQLLKTLEFFGRFDAGIGSFKGDGYVLLERASPRDRIPAPSPSKTLDYSVGTRL